MALSQTAIDELRSIHERHFNEPLSDEEAWRLATPLIRLVSILSRPESVHRSGLDAQRRSLV